MTASRQRLLALGLLAVAIGLAWLIVIQPVADAFSAQRDAIDDLHGQLAAYEARIALKPAVEMRLAEIKRHEASNTGLIAGDSPELAASNIQNMVKAVIESDAGQVRSAQNLAPTTADGFQRVEIQYDASIPIGRLKDVAYRLETSVPYLFLDGIDLRAPESWSAITVEGDTPLQVQWTVHGYRWTGPQ